MDDPRSVRCAQRDRDAVEAVLRSAYEEGRLDATEFAERLDRLHAARTYADLGQLVRDVPHELAFLEPVREPAHRPVPAVATRRAPRRRGDPGRVLRTVLIVSVAVLAVRAAPSFPQPMIAIMAVTIGGLVLFGRGMRRMCR
jgi:hypothetical protein